MEQLVNTNEGCTDTTIDSDTAEDVFDHSTDYAIVENVPTVDETKDILHDETGDDLIEVLDSFEEDISALETEDNSAVETEVNSVVETEVNSAEETDEEDIIEVDGKKGKLVARNLSVQEAKDFFDNL